MIDFNIVLFDDFETLDAFGPAEIIGRAAEFYRLRYISLFGGVVTSSHQAEVVTERFSDVNPGSILLIPGGMGTRTLVNDAGFMRAITALAKKSAYVLTVCTGSALLAKTGLLNHRCATSNKRAFEWVKSVNIDVDWVDRARWVVDDNFYTSSGVTAGMDMTLGFIGDLHGKDIAEEIASTIEYIWNGDKDSDPFSLQLQSF